MTANHINILRGKVTQPYTESQLKYLRFEEQQLTPLSDGNYYRWWRIEKNDSILDISYVFDSSDFMIEYLIDFNGETLQGTPATLEDLKTLINLM